MASPLKRYGRLWTWLDELQFRRQWLAVSLVVILALIAGLVVKIRSLERKK